MKLPDTRVNNFEVMETKSRDATAAKFNTQNSIYCIIELRKNPYLNTGGGQNLERPNIEWPIFRKFEASNIKITKVELFDFFICKFISYFYVCLNCSNTQNI